MARSAPAAPTAPAEDTPTPCNIDFNVGTTGTLLDDGSPSLVKGHGGKGVVVIGYSYGGGLVVRPLWEGGPLSLCLTLAQFAATEDANG